MAGNPGIKVDGLSEFRDAIKRMDGDAQDRLHEVLKAAAKIWQQDARKRTPKRSGRAAHSIRVVFAADSGTLMGGGQKVPYFRWLDYGGWVGKNPRKARMASTEHQRRRASAGRAGSVHRPVEKHGRIIYPAFHAKYDEVMETLTDGLRSLATDVGIEFDG